jgi:hypothetical protein
MSNIFKSNSRFSALVDDIPPQNNNSKKDKEEKNERFNSFKSERESPFRERYREQEQREKERIKQESLKIENFPDLIIVSNKKEFMEDIKKVSYIEKLQKEDDIKNYIDPDLENLKPGWVLLKSDPLTRRTIIKHHPEINIIEKKEKTEKEIAIDVLNVLVDIHEKRTREYIEKFGYDEWEAMFKFPDWREREAYLEQMENETNDSEYDEYEYEYEYEDED